MMASEDRLIFLISKVYQKLINNQIDDHFTEEIRVPVFKNKIGMGGPIWRTHYPV